MGAMSIQAVWCDVIVRQKECQQCSGTINELQ